LREMYGARIYTPTDEDSAVAFEDYYADYSRRRELNLLKPGENSGEDNSISVTFTIKGRGGPTTFRGRVAVQGIIGPLLKMMFDRNPNHEFFLQQTLPVDWMYPHLLPHGLILKINREPLLELSDRTVKQDHDYWKRYTARLIGGWLTEKTSVVQVCDFAKRVHLRGDLKGFKGDPKFLSPNRYPNANEDFGDLRGAVAGLYSWRAANARTTAEKTRMANEADFAFRQAFALCPWSRATVTRYVELLVNEKRPSDAARIAETALELAPNKPEFSRLANELRNSSKPN
jgi:hypothetical protein